MLPPAEKVIPWIENFDGVRFAAFSHDHPPPHVYAYYADAVVVIDLLVEARAVRVSKRRQAVEPPNAKRSAINHVRETARKHFDELMALWESAGWNKKF